MWKFKNLSKVVHNFFPRGKNFPNWKGSNHKLGLINCQQFNSWFKFCERRNKQEEEIESGNGDGSRSVPINNSRAIVAESGDHLTRATPWPTRGVWPHFYCGRNKPSTREEQVSLVANGLNEFWGVGENFPTDEKFILSRSLDSVSISLY